VDREVVPESGLVGLDLDRPLAGGDRRLLIAGRRLCKAEKVVGGRGR